MVSLKDATLGQNSPSHFAINFQIKLFFMELINILAFDFSSHIFIVKEDFVCKFLVLSDPQIPNSIQKELQD